MVPELVETLLSLEKAGKGVSHADLCKARQLPPPPVRPIRTIAVFYHRFYCGGIERVISEQFRHFRNLGYKIVLITEVPASPRDFPVPPDVVREQIPPRIEGRAEALREIFDRNQVDLYYTHASFAPQTLWDLLIVRHVLGRRVVVHAHGIFPCSLVWGENDLERRRDLYLLADKLIALTRADAFYYRAFGIDCRYVPNPVTEIPRSEVSADDRLAARLVLSVGRICSVKQTLDVLRTADVLRKADPSIKFLIVGSREDYNYWQQVQNLYRQLGLGDVVSFMDYTSSVADVYDRGSLLLVTSRLEGFPMVMAEAKGHGLPVVSYEMPYVEFMRQPDSGILTAPQGDCEGLAAQIRRLLDDRDLYVRYSEASRLSYERMDSVDAIQDAYREVVESAARDEEMAAPVDSDARAAFEALLPQMQTALRVSFERGWRDGAESVGSGNAPRRRAPAAVRALTWPFRMLRKTVWTLRSEGVGAVRGKVVRKIRALRSRFMGGKS